MAKLIRRERDLKTVRETELSISRRFRRSLDGLDYGRLRDDLRAMFRDGVGGRGAAYTVFYFAFAFNIPDIDTDEVSPDIQRYIIESLKRRFKGRFDEIDSAPEAGVFNWRVFTSATKARAAELENFLDTLPALFDREVTAKFNVEVDHEIFLVAATLVLKKGRREKEPRRGKRSTRKRSRVRLVVYRLKAHKKRKRRAARKVRRPSNPQRRKAARRVKRSGKSYPKKRQRSKKSRRF